MKTVIATDKAEVLKGFVMVAGQLSLIGLAIASFVTGDWIFGLVVLFVGVPLWLFVSDLLTGLLIAPVILLAEKPWRRDKDAGVQRIPPNGYQRHAGEPEQLRLATPARLLSGSGRSRTPSSWAK